MEVAVTGGTGFIGRSLIKRHLSSGDTVRVLSRQNIPAGHIASGDVQPFEGNLLSKERIPDGFIENVDILYHCAAELYRPELMEDLHVKGTINLLDKAEGKIKRWIQLSSVGVYGIHKTGVVTEKTPLNPNGLYERTKAKSDKIILKAMKDKRIEATLLRPSNVFGPDMTNRSVFKLISMIHAGRFFFIGNPGASANYIHVRNVAEALWKCGTLKQAGNAIYNISDHMLMEDFVNAISQALGRERVLWRIPGFPVRLAVKVLERIPSFPLTSSRVDALTLRSKYQIDKIREELGYDHLIPMKKALNEMVDEWRHQASRIAGNM